ncbi:Alpha/Beta hydrolase protein [Dactylonectria estremocensis]|uniref:Alpha/Beta hydrolase protein n=1 Tax=Dactylonectria estremocensis TaxID=1079267 RepID=A0A9P9EXU1_9HYPO|nr:Alpha/Beta hydrolase protein [Dactylonectria estremocensis]
MAFPDPELEAFVFKTAPPLDPAWLEYEEEVKKRGPPRIFSSVLERQSAYSQECLDFQARMMAPGARDYELSEGIHRERFTITASLDRFNIPVLQLELAEHRSRDPEIVIIYYHGGGLRLGEADSEELSCRHLVKSGVGRFRLYSVGYRLLPLNPASTCLSDCMDGFKMFHTHAKRVIVAGSSSGGQMATAIAQAAPKGSIHGLLLRCPVTADVPTGMKFIPERLRPYHTSVSPTFITSLNGYYRRDVPRDGLERLPLEVTEEELEGQPRTWVQLCSNDTIYSDGLCYALALRESGVEAQVEIEVGWPHTYWLKAPHLPQALAAEKKMIDGLRWLLQG